MQRAVFLDRDGVLIRDADLLVLPEQVELSAGAPQAVGRLRASGFKVVVISNQTVIARGLASEEDVESVHNMIQKSLSSSGGGLIDRFYFCPHHPQATLPEYRIECQCRKPGPGMLLRAAGELDLDLEASYMVGDRPSDIIAGQSAGCRTILVQTGMHVAPPIYSPYAASMQVEPDYVCAGLDEAVDIILGPAG